MSFLTKLAKNQPCLIRLPSCDGGGFEGTTVPCHYRDSSIGAGMGIKPEDIFCAFGCVRCHDAVDFRREIDGYTRAEICLAHAVGVFRTLDWLMDHGHVQIGKWKESA